jgi:mandelate racemase
MNVEQLTLRAIKSTAVSVPMARPLGTSAQTIRNAPLLLVSLETEEGITGHAYAFCYLESVARSLPVVVESLSNALAGQKLAPLELARLTSKYFKLTGLNGPLCMIASAVDVAAWDALSISAGMPLGALLGGKCDAVPAYNSNGLGLMAPGEVADEAEALLSHGFRAIKMRLGRASFSDDLAAIREVRKRLPDEISLMTDFNQALTPAQAMQYCPALDGEGVYWIEEPIRHDDFAHAARIADATKTPIQLGENIVGLRPLLDVVQAEATDFLMFDLDRIGGVSGWQLASGLASASGKEVSSHLFPEVSAHLLCATPTRHWLEYVDWANPILQEPLQLVEGNAIVADRPGNGLKWNDDAVARYRLD